MKTSILFKTINFAFLVIGMLSFGTMRAQQTTGDVTKASDIVPGTTTTGGAIRVIDNRGTIKYIQTQNGVTILSILQTM